MTEGTKHWMDRDPSLVQHEEATPSLSDAPVGRRAFLAGLGVSGVIGLSGCDRLPLRKAIPYLIPPEEIVPGVPVSYASTCSGCRAACGVLVQCRDGRPIKLEGLKDHPDSQGGLCAAGHGQLRSLYDAGRLRGPQRAGADSNWEEVDASVLKGLRGLGGKPLAIVTRTIVSPAMRAALDILAGAYGGDIMQVEAPGDPGSAIANAYHALTGTYLVPALSLKGVRLLLTVGGDLLGTGRNPVAHTAQYAAGRGTKERLRHVAIEGSLSLTGAAADKRHAAGTHERRWYLARLVTQLRQLGATGLEQFANVSVPAPTDASWVDALAEDLWKHRGTSLVTSGSTEVEEQILVAALNRALGNEGKSVRVDEPTPFSDDKDALRFSEGLRTGKWGGVIVVGANPVEELPDGESIAEALRALSLSACLTDRMTGTAAAAQAVASVHHAMESWGDAAPRVGVRSILQPTLRPLFDTRDPLEVVLRWAGHAQTDPRQFVRAQWAAAFGGGVWNSAVSKGGVWGHPPKELTDPPPSDIATGEDSKRDAGGAAGPGAEADAWSPERLIMASAAVVARIKKPAPELEVELLREVGLLDGQSCANPWVRELPDPLTRVSWDAVARIAPARADSMGISDGAVVGIKVGEAEVQLPVRVQPGLPSTVIAVPVGYGLRDGDGAVAHRNAYRLVQSQKGGLVTSGLAAAVSPTGQHVEVPVIQPHPSAEGRPIIHQVESSEAAVHSAHGEPAGHHGGSMWSDYDYSETHWEMLVDLDKCTGCGACTLSCQSENNIPVVGPEQMRMHRDMGWIRIDRYFEGDESNPDVLFEPMLCAQCDNAPCETVCPVAATVHSADGLNLQAYNRCVGTRYCANNCPYKVRRFNWLNYTPTDPLERLALNPDVVVRERGVMEKCTFCVQRIQRSRIESKKSGEPMKAPLTACQQSCPASAIHFENGAKPSPAFKELKEAKRAFQVLGELGTRPSITYLARIRPKEGDA